MERIRRLAGLSLVTVRNMSYHCANYDPVLYIKVSKVLPQL